MAKLYLAGNQRAGGALETGSRKGRIRLRRASGYIAAQLGGVGVLRSGCTIAWACRGPAYPSDAPDNIAYILDDSGARLLLLQTQGRWETMAPLCSGLTQLKKVLTVQNSSEPKKASSSNDKVVLESVDDWLAEAGATGIHEAENDGSVAFDPEALATLVYTSGTTGRPKGVMLSHHNVLWNSEATLKAIHGYRSDIYLSLLPLSHMFERTVGYYVQ